MKKIILLSIAILALVFTAEAQTSFHERDSVAHTPLFQSKVKMATRIAAGQLLADPGQPIRIRQYSQLIITDPDGFIWILALSCGVMSDPGINWDSGDGSIQNAVNSIFGKYAYAYYRELPE